VAGRAVVQIGGRNFQRRVGLCYRIRLVLVASKAGVFGIFARMAFLAGNFTLPAMLEREGVLAQGRWRPGHGSMAVLAFQSKETSMDCRLSVALHALCRRALEDLVLMASGTVDRSVLAVQDKDSLVVESAHAVGPIMALQAIGAKLTLVLLHKAGLSAGMAIDAGLHIKVVQPAWMAGLASDRIARIIFAMQGQAKSCLLDMVERFSG